MAITVLDPGFPANLPSFSSGATNPTPTIPAASNTGDFLVAIFVSREATDGTVSLPVGWTERIQDRGIGGIVGIWTKPFESGDSGTTVTMTLSGHSGGGTGDSCIGVIQAVRPTSGRELEFVDVSTPTRYSGSYTTFGPIEGATLTVAHDGIVFVIGQFCETWATVSGLSGDGLTWTTAVNFSNSQGADNALAVYWALSDNVAITDKSFTVTTPGFPSPSVGVMLFLKESQDEILGQASTSGAGSLAPVSSKAISGLASTSAIGSVSHGGFASPLLGQVITLGQGLFDDQHGQVFISEQGSLAPVLTPTGITGQSITSAQGIVTPEQTTGDITVHLNSDEQFIQSFVGSVLPDNYLSGQASTSAAGTATPVYTVDLVGTAFTASAGMLSSGIDADDTYILSVSGTTGVDQSFALLGQEITGGHGEISTTGSIDKEDSLFGADMVAIETATVLPEISMALVGEGITSSQYNVSAPGIAELSGQAVLVEQGFFGRDVAITGSEATFAQGTIEGLPGIVALVGELLSVQQGSFTTDRTQWTTEEAPTTPWTPASGPTSSWTRRSGPGTTWNRKT
jgi:hypothetical protein